MELCINWKKITPVKLMYFWPCISGPRKKHSTFFRSVRGFGIHFHPLELGFDQLGLDDSFISFPLKKWYLLKGAFIDFLDFRGCNCVIINEGKIHHTLSICDITLCSRCHSISKPVFDGSIEDDSPKPGSSK